MYIFLNQLPKPQTLMRKILVDFQKMNSSGKFSWIKIKLNEKNEAFLFSWNNFSHFLLLFPYFLINFFIFFFQDLSKHNYFNFFRLFRVLVSVQTEFHSKLRPFVLSRLRYLSRGFLPSWNKKKLCVFVLNNSFIYCFLEETLELVGRSILPWLLDRG